MTYDVLTGLRIASTVLWAWVMFRVGLHTWKIYLQDSETRRRGWVYFRAYLLLQGFAIVFIFNPIRILNIEGVYFSWQASWLSVGVFITTLCAMMIHHGLDIVERRPARTSFVYFLIVALSVAYTTIRGLQ